MFVQIWQNTAKWHQSKYTSVRKHQKLYINKVSIAFNTCIITVFISNF